MLSAVRAELVTDLTAGFVTGSGVTVVEGWPVRVVAPAVLVIPPLGPWVGVGQFGGEIEVHLDALLLVHKELGELEAMLESVLERLTELDTWGFDGVDGPSPLIVGGLEFLGARVHLNTQTKLD